MSATDVQENAGHGIEASAENEDASPLAAATHAQEMEAPSPAARPATAGLEPQGDAPWQTPRHQDSTAQASPEQPHSDEVQEAQPEPYAANAPDQRSQPEPHGEAPHEARPEPYAASQPDETRQPDPDGEEPHEAHPEPYPAGEPEPQPAAEPPRAEQRNASPQPHPQQGAAKASPESELPWGGRPARDEPTTAPAKAARQEPAKSAHPDLPWQKGAAGSASPTEKAVDWKGMDALIESAEVHAKGQDADETADETADEWLSEREREVREAKAERDEAVADKQARGEAEGPKDAEGRRVKRASGGDDAE